MSCCGFTTCAARGSPPCFRSRDTSLPPLVPAKAGTRTWHSETKVESGLRENERWRGQPKSASISHRQKACGVHHGVRGNLLQDAHVHQGLPQHRERLRIEPAVAREHLDLLVVHAADHHWIEVENLGRDLDR